MDSAINLLFKNSVHTLLMNRNCCPQNWFVCKLEYAAHTLSIVGVGA